MNQIFYNFGTRGALVVLIAFVLTALTGCGPNKEALFIAGCKGYCAYGTPLSEEKVATIGLVGDKDLLEAYDNKTLSNGLRLKYLADINPADDMTLPRKVLPFTTDMINVVFRKKKIDIAALEEKHGVDALVVVEKGNYQYREADVIEKETEVSLAKVFTDAAYMAGMLGLMTTGYTPVTGPLSGGYTGEKAKVVKKGDVICTGSILNSYATYRGKAITSAKVFNCGTADQEKINMILVALLKGVPEK